MRLCARQTTDRSATQAPDQASQHASRRWLATAHPGRDAEAALEFVVGEAQLLATCPERAGPIKTLPGFPRLHPVHHVVDRTQQGDGGHIVIPVAVTAERQPVVDAFVGKFDHVRHFGFGAHTPGA